MNFDELTNGGQLQWIEGTKARWDGYLEVQRRPELMVGWFDEYMA
jgi:hypothetical protein